MLCGHFNVDLLKDSPDLKSLTDKYNFFELIITTSPSIRVDTNKVILQVFMSVIMW